MAETAESVLGISEAVLKAYPELQSVYDLFKAGNLTAAAEALQKTNYYRNISPTVRSRANAKLTQPGIYADAYAKYLEATRRRLTAKGITIPATDLEAFARQGYDSGLEDNQLDILILSSGKVSQIGGDVLGDITNLRTYANSFGVNYDTKYWQAKGVALAGGLTTTEDIQNEIRTTSASLYPAYADNINKGISMDASASAYKTSYASILEVDSDTVDYNNPKIRKALQYTVDGKPAVMPVWMFEKELRSSPEWAFTNNGRNTIDSLSLKVVDDFFGGVY